MQACQALAQSSLASIGELSHLQSPDTLSTNMEVPTTAVKFRLSPVPMKAIFFSPLLAKAPGFRLWD